MILEYAHCELKFNKNGKTNGNLKRKNPVFKIECDKCGKITFENQNVFEHRLKEIKKCYCGQCSKPLWCSIAGYKGTHFEDGSKKPNKGQFSRARVDAMTPEEYKIFVEQRRNASKTFHKKLNENAELKEAHYRKVFKNSKIGYISKAQKNIFKILKNDGFMLEYCVEGLWCDIVNPEKKIIIEYNGDFWHMNPRKYKPDDYNEVIKMTASEKWEKDKRRRFALRNKGYEVFVIWENKWMNERKEVFKFLEKFQSKKWEELKYTSFENEVKTKKMSNVELNKNKYVPIIKVEEYLKNGWVFGHIKRKDTKWNYYESRK